MALVARMVAEEVTGMRGNPWVACDPDDDGAKPTEEVFGTYHYGVPVWLRDASHVKPKPGQGSEQFKLAVVRSKDGDDPSNEWFTASPMGELSMTMENPAGFGYIVPGAEYRVTIERIRGPRSVPDKPLAPAFRVNGGAGVTINAGSSTNTVG